MCQVCEPSYLKAPDKKGYRIARPEPDDSRATGRAWVGSRRIPMPCLPFASACSSSARQKPQEETLSSATLTLVATITYLFCLQTEI